MKNISHNCPKLFFKATTESRVPKKLPKIPTLLPEAASKLVRKIVQSCSPRHWSPKLRFCKSVRQNGSPKPFCKAAPESYAPKLLPKATLQNCYASNLFPKAAPRSCSCFPRLLPKAAPQSWVPKAVPQNYYRKLLRTAAPQSC